MTRREAEEAASEVCQRCRTGIHCPCWHDDSNWLGHGLSARYICTCSGGVGIVYPFRERRVDLSANAIRPVLTEEQRT